MELYCKYCRFINVRDVGTLDVRGVLILRVSHLAFYFHMQALYLVTFIFTILKSLMKLAE